MQQVVQVENYWTLRESGWAHGEDLMRPYQEAALVRVPFLLFHEYDDEGQVSIKPIDAVQVSEGYTVCERSEWTRWFQDEAAAQTAALTQHYCHACGSTDVQTEREHPGGEINWFSLRLMHDAECYRWQSHLETLRKRRAKDAGTQPSDPLLRLADRLEAAAEDTGTARPKGKRKRQGLPARNSRSVTSKGGE